MRITHTHTLSFSQVWWCVTGVPIVVIGPLARPAHSTTHIVSPASPANKSQPPRLVCHSSRHPTFSIVTHLTVYPATSLRHPPYRLSCKPPPRPALPPTSPSPLPAPAPPHLATHLTVSPASPCTALPPASPSPLPAPSPPRHPPHCLPSILGHPPACCSVHNCITAHVVVVATYCGRWWASSQPLAGCRPQDSTAPS